MAATALGLDMLSGIVFLAWPAVPGLIAGRVSAALLLALAAIAFELLALARIRWRLFSTGFVRSFIPITLGGAIIATLSAALGALS